MNKSIKLERKNIQDILALTPMQEGLLFHYLQAPQEDSYLNQLDLEVSGDINLQHFKEAWNYVIESNEMLRTVFRWEKLETPFQVVLKRHTLHWTFEDLSIVGDGEEQKRQWNMVKQQDRGSQFDLRQVPFRVILGKMSQYRYHMLISNHHILYDGWSTGIILKEFLLAYEVLAVGNQPLVPRVKSRFKEFTQWHREQDRREQKKFWQNYLEGFDTPARLPIKRLKQSPGSPGERNYRLHLCRTVKDKLEVLVKEKRITLAAFFYCAWGVLLQKYGDMEDVVFGITVSGRSAPIKGIEDMVGLFINTIPLRVGFDPDESLMDFLVRINNHLAAGEKYEYTSLVDIYRYCRQSMQVKEELFDTLVLIENYPLDTYLKVPGSHLSIQSYEMEERPHYDLTLVISAAEEIDIDFIYNNTCLDKKTIVRLAHHFSTILKGIIENVGYRPQEIEILSGEEKHQLLVDFNRTAADYPKEKTIYGLFEEQVERAPDHIALVGAALDNCPAFPVRPVRLVRPVRPVGQIQLTYHELNEQSNRLARWLIGKGVQTDTIVGIMMERSVELIVSMMGILKAGAAYLPIDPEYPQERIDYILKDSSARILLKKSEIRNPKSETNPNDKNLNDKNSTSTCLVLNFEHLKFEFLIGRPRRGLSNFEIRASNLSSSKLAYVIYTSGTTGKPKGVGIEHRSVINFIKGITDIIPFTEDDRILSLTTISFDIFGLETLVPLTNGSTIVMGGREEQLNPEAASIILERERISIFQTTPSRLGIIIDSPGRILSLKKVNFLLVGGEVFSKLLLEKTKPLVKGRIFNMYGPTETTIWSTVKELSAREALNIGKPIANTLIYILDNLGKLQPIELVGELCIGGDGLARGYLNNPELTREKFIFYRSYRSYMTYISKKIYKTGDLARWLPDGNIEFLGRIDHQVKIRGSRIELGEIESRLNRHPGIKATVVVVKTDNSGDNYLCAYVVSDTELPASALNDYLSKYLPGYMVPSYFVRMEKIPLTPSGKVDRGALPEPGLKADGSYTAPRDEIEKKLVEIWSGVLGSEKEKIGINDNFFHLGGHSLKAMLLVSRIHKELKVNVPLPEIFKTSHIRGLARYIKNSTGDKYAPIEALEKKEY
jgi:amino acid adenylation domain-containing protein